MAGVNQALRDAAVKAGAPGLMADEGGTLEPLAQSGEGEESPEQPESDASTENSEAEEFPEDYFGTNIQQYAEENGAEAAKALYKGLQDANRVANRRLQELAELRKQAEEDARRAAAQQRVTPPSEEEAAELTPEELLEAAGIDARILQYEELGQPVAQLVKLVLDQARRLDDFTEVSDGEKWQRQFYGSLEGLEAQHGKIPFDRGAVEEYAIERNIFDPEALYWAIMGPVMAESGNKAAATDKRVRDLKKSISTPRRRGGAQGSTQTARANTLAEHLENAKKNLGISEDPFATPGS